MTHIILPGALAINGVALGPLSPMHDLVRAPRRRGRPEDDHQRKYIQPVYAAARFDVNVLSSRRWAKGVTAGVPDLYLQYPAASLLVWHEAKWNTRQSIGQHEFMQREISASIAFYVLGQAVDAAAFIEWMGLNQRKRFTNAYPSPAVWYETQIFRDQVERWGYREPRRRGKRKLVSR